jgi:hypothetical protein
MPATASLSLPRESWGSVPFRAIASGLLAEGPLSPCIY